MKVTRYNLAMNNHPPLITVIGDMNVDVSLAIDAWPVEGGDVLANAVNWSSGGTGLNCAVAIARIGHPVQLWSRIGPDPAASQVMTTAQRAGVDTSEIQTDPTVATGLCVIPVTPGGERTFLSFRGANVRWQSPAGALAPQGWLHVCGHALLADPQRTQSLQALQRAHAAGWHTSLDLCDPLAPLVIALLRQLSQPLSVLLGNEREIAATGGVLHPYAEIVVTKRGAHGATAQDGTTQIAHPGFAVDAIDTTACGDTFGGVFCVARSRGASLPEALSIANVAGAITASRRGAADIEPTRAEIIAFLTERTLDIPHWLA